MTSYRFQRHELAPDFSISTHRSTKNKTNRLAVYWVGDLRDADVTSRALLPSLLCRGTLHHPTRKALTQHLEQLYGASLYGDVFRVGAYHVMSFVMEFASDAYLPAGEAIFDQVVDFLQQVLTEPALDGGAFPEDWMQQELAAHQRHIEGLINDKSSYASRRLMEKMCADEPFRIFEYGSIEDLAAISGQSLAESWKGLSKTSQTHIYVAGDIDEQHAVDQFSKLAQGRGSAELLSPLPALREVSKTQEHVERMELSQTNLLLGYRSQCRHGDALSLPMALANGVFGQGPSSKLFLNVREKASLCYSISSGLDRSSGLLIVHAGIKEEKRQQAQQLIGEQLKAVQDGEVSDEEFNATKISFINRLQMIEDSPSPLINIDLVWRLNGGVYDHEQYSKEVASITKEQIIEASRQLQLDTVYVLAPDSEQNDSSVGGPA